MLKGRRTLAVSVCVGLAIMFAANYAFAWDYKQAAFAEKLEDQCAPGQALKPISKIKSPKPIVKCKPPVTEYPAMRAVPVDCILPMAGQRGWQLDAQALFAKSRGKVRYYVNNFGWNWTGQSFPDVDFNSQLGLPEHQVIGTYSATYRFQPQWGIRYSFMPIMQDGSGTAQTQFNFGTFMMGSQINTSTKWERLYHRAGLVFDPIRTMSSRVSIFGDYVRVDDKIKVYQTGCCGETMNNEMNLAMAGVEFERCLKTTRMLNTLSLECKAGVAFGDNTIGSDLSTGLKFSIPMNNGRWGYISGGYRYVSLNKKYSDARLVDTTLDGGYVQLGVIF